jgi:hypothetical protein
MSILSDIHAFLHDTIYSLPAALDIPPIEDLEYIQTPYPFTL